MKRTEPESQKMFPVIIGKDLGSWLVGWLTPFSWVWNRNNCGTEIKRYLCDWQLNSSSIIDRNSINNQRKGETKRNIKLQTRLNATYSVNGRIHRTIQPQSPYCSTFINIFNEDKISENFCYEYLIVEGEGKKLRKVHLHIFVRTDRPIWIPKNIS